MRIQIKILDKKFYCNEMGNARLNGLPSYATPGSAAIDLIATKDYTIYPGERVMIGTGLAIWIGSDAKDNIKSLALNSWDSFTIEAVDYQPVNIAGFILPRSGLGTKGLILANTIGLIDEDYKSELKISAWNSNGITVAESLDGTMRGDNRYIQRIELKAGDRIAQMYFAPVIKCEWDIVDEFTDPTITHKGFGSTDK